jgi:RHS repeat-associated protein
VDTPLQNKITEISYDPTTGATLLVSVKGYADGQYETRTTTFTEYTPHGQIKQINGPRTDVTDITNFEYYPDNDTNIFNRGMLYKVVNALNQITELGNYSPFGRPGQVKDANNIVTLLEYDARGRLTGKTVNGKETVYSYDKVGNLNTITPPGLKNIVTFNYTNANLLEYVYDQLGNYLKFSYDTEGNLNLEQNYTLDSVLKRYLDYEYNEFNRLNKIINPDTTFTLLETDSNGNLSQFSDAMNRVTQFDYDNLDRMTASTDPGAVISSFEYDSHDNPAQITDPENTATEYSHDDFGGLHTVISQDTGVVSYDYDTAGNLKSKIDANQVTENYDYDILNRLSSISYTPVDISQNIFFEYDEPQALHGIGQLTSTSDMTGSTSYQYDAYGFVTQEERILDSVTYNTLYSYNDRNNLDVLTYPTGLQVTYLRRDNEQVSGILIDDQTLTQNVSYMPFGPEEDFVFGSNVLTVDRKYFDNYFRLEILSAQVLTYQYQYFADDKVKSIEGKPDPVIPIDQTGYVKTAGTNLLDYITNPDQSVSDYIYDNNGNTTFDGIFTYTYNLRNRLVEVKQGSAVLAEYLYDPFGRRVKKTVSGTVTHYHYDQQGRLLSETTDSGAALRDYVYQNDNLVALKLYGAQAGIYYVINDHLGTPQQIVNSTGVVVWKAAYLPFGKAQILVETITNNIRFKGQYFDAETGLHYNWHRYYKPSTGRYLTPDPIGLAGGLNLFSYVQNDPVNYIDPEGLSPAGAFIKLSKKLYGKVMRPAAGKDARVKIYDKNGNYQNAKVFKDGRVSPDGAKLPKGVIDKAKNLLTGAAILGLESLNPFDAISGELGADDMLCSDGTPPPCNDPCK